MERIYSPHLGLRSAGFCPGDLDRSAIKNLSQDDKKALAGKVNYILPDAIGNTRITDDSLGQRLDDVLCRCVSGKMLAPIFVLFHSHIGMIMPIYEFYCDACNVIFNFFSRRINTTSIPSCPRCGKEKLTRQLSTFATIGKAGEETEDMLGGLDEAKMEQAFASLMREAEGMNEDDPRQMASVDAPVQPGDGGRSG